MLNQHPKSRGFTLTELAVVLVIVGLLIAGLMIPLSTQTDLRNYSETQKALSEIREVIVGYTLANGRLPCPANPTLASGSPGAGQEDCASFPTQGVLPWATLGVRELDAWGHRFTYRVTTTFADSPGAGTITPGCSPTPPPPPALSSFAICSEGDITVTDGAVTIASKVPVVIVSHGKNGRGGYQSDGTQVGGSAGDELENANNDAKFVSRVMTSAGVSGEYDDVIVWIPHTLLINRMLAAGRLP